MSAELARFVTEAMYVMDVPDRIAAALLADDRDEVTRILREAVGVAIAEHNEIEALRAEEAGWSL